nr:aspergillopepsin-1 [Quercus suber]
MPKRGSLNSSACKREDARAVLPCNDPASSRVVNWYASFTPDHDPWPSLHTVPIFAWTLLYVSTETTADNQDSENGRIAAMSTAGQGDKTRHFVSEDGKTGRLAYAFGRVAIMAASRNASNRLALHRNPKYKKDGLKSYGNLLRKYNITPTMEGPFGFADESIDAPVSRIQKVLKHFGKGNATASQPRLIKQDPSTGKPGQVSAEDIQNDSLYLAEVSIGTPAQTLKLDFDTGSADLWVWSTKLSSSLQTSGKSDGHTIFDPTQSSTFTNSSGETWQISYGDGSTASGTVGTDTIALGSIVIENQAIELASTLSAQFQQGEGDGLLGLAFDTINTVSPSPVKTPVDNLTGSKVFTAYLGSWRDADEADKGESFYTFGSIDQDVIGTKTILYTPVDTSNGFWEYPSTKSTVNGKAVQATGTAIADTGTTLALLDDATVKAVYAAIPGSKYDNTQQGYVFPTNTTADQLPVVQLSIGEHLVTLQKEDLGFADVGNGFVYGSIQSRGNMTQSIMGDAVLKSIYAIFDADQMRFGFVQRDEATQNVGPPPSA